MSMLRINDCYFHSIRDRAENTLITIDQILSKGAILSRASLRMEHIRCWHQYDDICISKYMEDIEDESFKYGMENGSLEKLSSSFQEYVKLYPSLLLGDKLKDVREPIKCPTFGITREERLKGLYSDKYDEFRIRTKISLEHLLGILVPIDQITSNAYSFLLFCDRIMHDCLYDDNASNLGNNPLHKGITKDNSKTAYGRKIYMFNYLCMLKNIILKNGYDIPIYTLSDNDGLKIYTK